MTKQEAMERFSSGAVQQSLEIHRGIQWTGRIISCPGSPTRKAPLVSSSQPPRNPSRISSEKAASSDNDYVRKSKI